MSSHFLGSETSAVDSKGRINIPARLRRGLSPEAADTFTLIRHDDGCVRLYPQDQWRVYSAQLLKRALRSDQDRKVYRVISDTAVEAAIDGQGRILVGRALLDYAGVDGQAKLVGMSKWIELWEPGRFVEGAQPDPEVKRQVADDIDRAMADLE